MNQQLEQFARETLKTGLSQLSESHHLLFKQMYSHENIELDINDVVDRMPVENLDWAMRQVDATIRKRENNATNA